MDMTFILFCLSTSHLFYRVHAQHLVYPVCAHKLNVPSEGTTCFTAIDITVHWESLGGTSFQEGESRLQSG